VRTEAHSSLWDKGLVSYVDGHGRPQADDRGRAIEAMSEAFSRFLSRQPDVGGVIGLGGSGGSAIIAPALQALVESFFEICTHK
jgi:uncharacterized protein (UPF0261 family)